MICKHKSHNSNTGFTIVEFLIVIVVIGILTAVAVNTYSSSQKRGKDTAKAADTRVVSSALEKYYSKNGTYPTNAQMTGSAMSVRSLLNIDPEALSSSTQGAGATNSYVTDPMAVSAGTYKYVATTNAGATCDGTTTAPCGKFIISYISEVSGSTVNIPSLHQ